MATTNRIRIIVAASAALWLGLGAAPLMAADDWQRIEHPTLDMLFTSTTVDTVRDWAARELGSAFAASGLELADAPWRDTMIVRVQFIDFTDTPVSEEALAWARRFRFNVEPGRVTMVAELIDARTGNTVLRMADMQDDPASGLSDGLQSALTGWSSLVASAVVTPTSRVQLASR